MKKLLIVITCFLSCICYGQINLDLSKKSNITQSISPQVITSITLINALPISKAYSISIIIKHTPTPPLTIPTGGGGGKAGDDIGACTKIAALTKLLDDESDEANIEKDVKNLNDAIDVLSSADKVACKAFIDKAKHEIDATTIPYTLPQPIKVGPGDELDITITREKNSWVYSFKNERINHWTTYYGFTYIPDMLTKFSNYYANQQTGGTYMISKMNGSNKNVLQNISPTAMFTYRFFEKDPDAFLKFGLTGGIMYNTDILGAMFGPSMVLGDNITINTGISFVQKYKLKGQYVQGQVIQTNLDFSQLHDKIWSYDMFFSIGFNIPELFTKKSSDAKTPAK